jgi:type I restriction enzyme S subunit
MQDKIRPGYKQTEVGVIPEDWDIAPLGSFGDFKGGNGFPLKYQGHAFGDYPLYKVSDMNNDGNTLFMSVANHWISEEVRKEIGGRIFPKGSIIFAKIGAAIFLERKRILTLPSCIDNNVMALVFNSDKADFRFFHYLFLTIELGKLVSATALPSLNGRDIASLHFAFPKPDEQRAIAGALGDADGLIAALEAMIAKKRDLKQAAMQHLLTGKTRLPGFSGEWEPRSLGSVSAFITKGATPTTYGFGWQTHGVLFLRSECVSDRGLDLSQSMFISQLAHKVLKRGEVCSGDLLITITGNVGRVVLLAEDFGVANINQHIARIRITSENANGNYVFHQLSHPIYLKYFNSIVTGQAYPQISLRQVREAIVFFPSITEQTAIAELLSDMDTDLAALESRAAKVRAVKQGMMQELLTGKVRLL